MNKGVTAKILEKLSEGAEVSAALFVTIMTSGYGASYSKLQNNFDKIVSGQNQNTDVLRKKQNFYLILSKLKREGFITNKDHKWSITAGGKEKLSKLLERLPRHRYIKEADSSVKIVIFDIPEKEQKKRSWLRRRLLELGFKILQKSVWMGKVKLPEEFLEDLREYNIFKYVDIFAVTKGGSLREIN